MTLRIERLISKALDSKGDRLRIDLLFGLSTEAAAFNPSEARLVEKFVGTQGP